MPAGDKAEGVELMRQMQRRIKEAKDLVVVGGGAAGVELATDAKSKYPEKKVTLVHSRAAVMHRFGPRLQAAALDGIKELGIDVITGDRVVSEDKEKGVAVLKSGKEIVCDFLVGHLLFYHFDTIHETNSTQDKLHRAEARLQADSAAQPVVDIGVRPYSHETYPTSPGRFAAQHLRLRRRVRDEHDAPELALCHAPGRSLRL